MKLRQRAMVAGKLANMKRGDNQHAQICATSQSDAAEMLSISERVGRPLVARQFVGSPELPCRARAREDAAQERGEVAGVGGNRGNQFASVAGDNVATAADLGLRRDEIHEARKIRDAEAAQPGVVEEAIRQRIEAGTGQAA